MPCLGAQEVMRFNTQEFPPYNYSVQGVVKGPVADLLRALCAEVKVACELHSHYFWERGQEEVREGRAHGLFVIGRNPGREAWLAFSPPLLEAEYGFFVHASNPLAYRRLADLAGYQVGVYGPSNTSYSLYALRDRMREQEIEPIRIEMWVDTPFGLQKLRVGSLEAVYSNRRVGEAWLEFYGISDLRYVGTHRTTPYYIGFSRKLVSPALIEQFTKAYQRLYRQGVVHRLFGEAGFSPLPLDRDSGTEQEGVREKRLE